MRPFHEMGQRYATELRPGNVNVNGTIGRAHINGALLKLMLGDGAAGSRPAGAFVSPTFNLSLRLENPAFPGNASTVTVHGVKLDGWSFTMPEDDFVHGVRWPSRPSGSASRTRRPDLGATPVAAS